MSSGINHFPKPETRTHTGVEALVYRQEHTHSCGIACAAMLVNRITGATPTENVLRIEAREQANGYRALPHERPPAAPAYPEGDGNPGMTVLALQTVLKQWKIPTSIKGVGTWEELKNNLPAIAFLRWPETGAHFVFLDRYLEHLDYIVVCDPGKTVDQLRYLKRDGPTREKVFPYPSYGARVKGRLFSFLFLAYLSAKLRRQRYSEVGSVADCRLSAPGMQPAAVTLDRAFTSRPLLSATLPIGDLYLEEDDAPVRPCAYACLRLARGAGG